MIRYALQCDEGHGFESWFANGAAFDSLAAAGQLSCPLCGSAKVSKALMVPSLGQAIPVNGRDALSGGAGPESAAAPAVSPGGAPGAGGKPAPIREDLEKALTALRRQIEDNSDYVGMNFAAEARRIHEGDAPERAIYGEAKPEEARQLIEDGIPVAPLPFLPRRKAN